MGREYVMPDDVKRVAPVVLEHRLLLTPDAELRGLSPADVLGDVLGIGGGARGHRPDVAP